MDKKFKIPLLVIAWCVAITVVAFVVLIIYGTILTFTTPGLIT